MNDYLARAEAQIAHAKRDFSTRHQVAKTVLGGSGLAFLATCAAWALGTYSGDQAHLLAFASLAAAAVAFAAMWARALIWKDQYLAEHTRGTLNQGEAFEATDRLRRLSDQFQDEAIYSLVIETTIAETTDRRGSEDSYRAGVVAGVERTFSVVGKSVEEGSAIKPTA